MRQQGRLSGVAIATRRILNVLGHSCEIYILPSQSQRFAIISPDDDRVVRLDP
jgi:hypothetical protein